MATATKRTTTTTEALSLIFDRLNDLVERDRVDHYIRQGASDVVRQLEPIEEGLYATDLGPAYAYDPDADTRHRALDLLIALEGGLSGTDNRTYGVDRAKVTPLIEDMLRAIVLGNVKFETEG